MNQKDRLTKLGMIKPTLQDPDFIIEDKRLPKDGSVPDRETAFVFVKSFIKEDGSRLYYFASVTVKKGNNEVIISNQEKSKSRIKRLLVNGKLAYINNSTLPSESNTSTQGDKPVNHVGGISGRKGTTNSGREQGNSGENSENLQSGEDVRFRVAPSEESADTYTTKKGKRVGFSSRLGGLRPLEEGEYCYVERDRRDEILQFHDKEGQDKEFVRRIDC